MANVRKSVLIALALGFLVFCGASAYGQSLTIRGDRWLQITELIGSVELMPQGGSRRQAQRGDRLTEVGDTLSTGANASARLEVDLQTGFVTMAENSQLTIAEQPQSLDRQGRFDIEVALSSSARRIQAVVITPLGTEQAYELVVP
ncbi:MAG: hypothetical protein ACR2FS_15510 [Phormidesmis sp.]